MECECVICNDGHAINLTCNHNVCPNCIVKIYSGFERTNCPVCQKIIDMDPILRLTPCAKCKCLDAYYCKSCRNFLCNHCWSEIHSFKPLDKHVRSEFSIDIVVRRQLFDQIEGTNNHLKKVEDDLANLNGEGLKGASVKEQTLKEIHKTFEGYYRQLCEQQEMIEHYINDCSNSKKEQILTAKVTLKAHSELCRSLFYEYDAVIPEMPTYTSHLEYDLEMHKITLPQIISLPQSPSLSEGDHMIIDPNGIQRWFNKDKLHRSNDLPAVIHPSGRKEWYLYGRLHRDNDQPAVIENCGRMEWYNNGLMHRDHDLPALIQASGGKHWFQDGKYHRIGAPAYIGAEGEEQWYQYGVLHRDDGPALITKEYQRYYSHGKRHRDHDEPACILKDRQMWFQNDRLHRDHDRPAIIYNNGKQEYYINGQLHRANDQPAITYPNGNQEYYIDGKLHRDLDLPAIIRPNHTKKWYQNGVLHRDNDQPAIISDKKQCWYKNGLLHREHGQPSIIHKDDRQEFYLNGKKYQLSSI